jgi:hypothetical protein
MNYNFFKFLIVAFIIVIIITGCREAHTGSSDPNFIAHELDFNEKIRINLPARGDIYVPGESLEIKWISSSSLVKVDIFLYRKSDLKRTIVQNYVNSGSYIWQIPGNIDNSNNYFVKAVNSSNNEEFNFSGIFGIIGGN